MKKMVILLTTLFFCISSQSQNIKYSLQTDSIINYQQLKQCFISPPKEAQLRCYWGWLNSMVTKESITSDLKEMKEKGYGGALLFDGQSSSYSSTSNQKSRYYEGVLKTQAGPVFMSPEWMKLYKHAVREADRFGIELSLNVQSGWNPGGPSITPEFAMKKLTWSETDIEGGKLVQMDLPQPKYTLMYKDVIVQAIPKPSQNSPLKDDAISNWSIKSFNEPLGWKGKYPLYKLREGFDNPNESGRIKKDEIIDLTAQFDGKTLHWNAPPGNWIVIRYGYTCTGVKTSSSSDGWGGLSLDHLNPDAFRLFANTVIQPLIDVAQKTGNSLKYLFTESWEMGVVNWTNHFPEEFKRLRGYDLTNYMPVMTGRIIENQEISNRFLHDLRKTVSDCIIENHYQLFCDLAHNNGMGLCAESGGPHSAPIDALRVMKTNDIPMGEFWGMSNTHRILDAERLSVRQSACAAHTNGKRIVAAEGPTFIGPHWERSPKDLKRDLDRVFCSGLNRNVYGAFTSSPKEFGVPGNQFFAEVRLDPNVTWWKQANDFISYLNRCNYMLQQGLFVADVLYYYGDDVPNFVFLKEEYPELKFGYDWDKCSKDVVLDRLSINKGKIILPDGMSYRLMVLSPEESIDLAVLRKIERLVKEGMIVIGPRPPKATGLTNFPVCDQEVVEIADRLWGKIDGKTVTENRCGKGRVIWGQDVNDVLAGMQVIPDFEFTGTHPEAALDYIHRTTADQEIYFVANRFDRLAYNDSEYRYLPDLPDRYEQVECRFRVTRKVPEFWNPITGEVSEILIYREENGQTVIPLHFEPQGSKFIVFKETKQEPHVIEIRKDNQTVFPLFSLKTRDFPPMELRGKGNAVSIDFYEPGNYSLTWSDGRKIVLNSQKSSEIVPLAGKWNIRFDPKWGAPEHVETDTLKSWTEFSDEGIKYYSGTATYHKSFILSAENLNHKRLLLDLGNVQEMASVKINGHQIQVIWTPPFRFDITPFAKSGTNELEVEVVNLWPNRLIGDGKLPENKRLTRTNIIKFNGPDAEQYLRVSGLMGPVNLRVVNYSPLKINDRNQ